MADCDSTLGRFERQCATCGKIFKIGTGRGQARKYCAPKCVPPRAPPTKRCDVPRCSRNARSNASPYCETHYYRLRRNGSLEPTVITGVWAECQYCGVPTGGNKYCDSRCGARHRRGNPKTKPCATCGRAFDPRSDHGPDSNVCGEGCAAERDRVARREYYRQSMKTPKGRERIRSAEYRRRARKRDAFVEDVSRDEVMRRGRWECHLCGEKIPKSAKWPEPMFGTVDHVLPLSQGGAHSYANCKPAHLKCNCSKGAKPIGQLGLAFVA